MNKVFHSTSAVTARVKRVRASLHGSKDRPRISVHRSNKYIWIQAINDDLAQVMLAVSDRELRTKNKSAKKITKTESAQLAGEKLAQELKKIGVNKAVFDRGQYRYHGRVAAVAQALRQAEIKV